MRARLSVVVLAAFAWACQSPADSDSTAQRIERIESGLIPALIVEGEALPTPTLAQRMEHYHVPGVSVAVIEGGEIEWARGFGLADVDSGRAVTGETLFQAASISKPLAAMAALSLVEEGLLDLDGDVNAKLTSWTVPDNEFTGARSVTLRGLLNHTAGLTVHGFPGYGPGEIAPSTAGVLDGKGNTGPVRVDVEPGSLWRYSGGGYTVMQLLAEDVTGKPFPEVMSSRVLEPLGMERSTYRQPLPDELHSRAATAYRSNGEAIEGRFHTYPEMAAAGLWTTPTDLARYLISVQRAKNGEDHPVISTEMIDRMLTPGMNGHGLGPGISKDHLRFGHGGANAGFRCNMTAFIQGGQGAVIMTNSDQGGQLAREILLTIAHEYGWTGVEPVRKVVATLSDNDLDAIVGVYQAAPGQVRLERHQDRLRAYPSWRPGQEIELLSESRTRLFSRESGPSFEVVWTEDGSVRAVKTRGIEFARVE